MVIRANTKLILLFLGIFLSTNSSNAQVQGLWEVTSVTIGDESRTPVAKWNNLRQSRRYESGNGWLQNSSGTWDYDVVAKKLNFIVSTGFDNPFGPFDVEFPSEDEMIWTREENGDLVTVRQRRIINTPKSPATKAVGLWMVSEVRIGGQIKTDDFKRVEFEGVFVRWDNLLQEITSDGRKSGIWRVDAHRSVIDILYYEGDKPLQYWDLEFANENKMTWTRGGIQISFNRLTSFPED